MKLTRTCLEFNPIHKNTLVGFGAIRVNEMHLTKPRMASSRRCAVTLATPDEESLTDTSPEAYVGCSHCVRNDGGEYELSTDQVCAEP